MPGYSGGVVKSVKEEEHRKRGPRRRLNNVWMREQVLAWDDETRSSVELVDADGAAWPVAERGVWAWVRELHVG